MKLKLIFPLAAGLFFLTSCSDDFRFERDRNKILKALTGSWQIDEVVITLADGSDSIPSRAYGTLAFAACEVEGAGGFCEITQILADGSSYVFSYQVQVSLEEGNESLQFFEPTGGIDPGLPITDLLRGATSLDAEALLEQDELMLVNRSLTAFANNAESVQIRASR